MEAYKLFGLFGASRVQSRKEFSDEIHICAMEPLEPGVISKTVGAAAVWTVEGFGSSHFSPLAADVAVKMTHGR